MSELCVVKKEDGRYYKVTSGTVQSVIKKGDTVVYDEEELTVKGVYSAGKEYVSAGEDTQIPYEEFSENAGLLLKENSMPQRLEGGLGVDRGILNAYIIMRFITPLEGLPKKEADSLFTFDVELKNGGGEEVELKIYEQKGYYFTWEEKVKLSGVFSSKQDVQGYILDRVDEISENCRSTEGLSLDAGCKKDNLNLNKGQLLNKLVSLSM
jgi:hypothetical protein